MITPQKTQTRRRQKMMLTTMVYGLPGVLAVSVFLVPVMTQGKQTPVPISVMIAVSFLQTMVMLALASWAGSRFAPQLGLTAPVAEALVDKRSVRFAFKQQVPGGVVGGALGFVVLLGAHYFVPPALSQASLGNEWTLLLVKLFYGGVTEEVLLRWGLMSAIACGFWYACGRRRGAQKVAIIFAIIVSAILFGVGHLPAASALTGGALSLVAICYIIVFNALFGLIAGFLFWRYGLESAIIAHALTHLSMSLFLALG